MDSSQRSIRFFLPALAILLIVSAVVSANQWISDRSPIAIPTVEVANDVAAIGPLRMHTIALNSKGQIEGRVVGFSSDAKQGLHGLSVFFLSEGSIVGESKTDAQGVFKVDGLAEGPYSFIATGEQGFAAYGIQVVGESNQASQKALEATAVAPNLQAVQKILSQHLPEKVVEELVVNSGDSLPNGTHRVKLSEGNLRGTIHSLVGGQKAVRDATIHLLKDNDTVASVQADDTGSFNVPDVDPGVYGFVAVGPYGFAAISFEAIQNVSAADIPAAAGNTVVSAVQPIAVPAGAEPIVYQDSLPIELPVESGTGTYSNSLEVCLTCGNSGYSTESMTYDPGYVSDFAPVEYASQSIGYGGACGGACGSCGNMAGFSSCCGGGLGAGRFGGIGGGPGLLGGGAPGGLGRLGRLALLGGTVVGVVAIADGNNPGAATNPAPQ